MKDLYKRIRGIRLLILASCALIFSIQGDGQSQTSPPKRELPAPTGKLAIGRTSFHWIDTSRPEEMTDDPNDRRELVATLWYPADATTGEFAPYIDNLDRLAGAIDQIHVNIARTVQTHTIAGARISVAQSRYPVLIFSPGNQMNAALYATQIEDLVSHGYMVLGIDPPYESLGVLYPDGRIARYTEEKYPKQAPRIFRRSSRVFYKRRVDWRAADAAFALHQLEKLDTGAQASPFKGRLDLARVGAFGHSIGGVAAAQTCQNDRRFKACANLDGKANSRPLFPGADGKGPEQPFLTFEKSLPEPTEKQLTEWKTTREQVERSRAQMRDREAELLKTVKSGCYRITLRGATTRVSAMSRSFCPLVTRTRRRRTGDGCKSSGNTPLPSSIRHSEIEAQPCSTAPPPTIRKLPSSDSDPRNNNSPRPMFHSPGLA
jgi:hypothetical protein